MRLENLPQFAVLIVGILPNSWLRMAVAGQPKIEHACSRSAIPDGRCGCQHGDGPAMTKQFSQLCRSLPSRDCSGPDSFLAFWRDGLKPLTCQLKSESLPGTVDKGIGSSGNYKERFRGHRENSVESNFSNEEMRSILCHFFWSSRRSGLKQMFRQPGETTTLRLVGRGHMGRTVELTFRFATGDIMPFVEMALHRDVPVHVRNKVEREYRRLVQPYFAEPPYGLIGIQVPPANGVVTVSQHQNCSSSLSDSDANLGR